MGPMRDGVWREEGVLESFPEGGPKVLWRVEVHQGYAGPAVAGGRVYVMDRELTDPSKAEGDAFKRGRIPGNERIVCFDAETGKLLWERSYDCEYTVSYAAGPRATPTVDGDRVFTLGAEGNLVCWRAADGAELWSRDFKHEFGVETPVWGFSASPLVDGELLICLARGDGTTAVAFDKATGDEKWRALSAKEPGYAPPRIIEHAGRRLLIIWHPESVNALDPGTGEVVWSVAWPLRSGLSVPTPITLEGGRLFLSSFYNGSMMLQLKEDHSAPDVLWRTEKASEHPERTTHLHGIMATAVADGGYLYGLCSYGEFRCLDAKTGERVWDSFAPLGLERPTRWGTAFLTPHGDRFFLFTEKGDLVMARLSPGGYEEISRAHVIEPDGADLRQRRVVWSHPAYADRCCFVRNDSELVCLSLAADGAPPASAVHPER
jgi:outer membrane protein assembly factor BamB